MDDLRHASAPAALWAVLGRTVCSRAIAGQIMADDEFRRLVLDAMMNGSHGSGRRYADGGRWTV
jgi:hypothetical protein